MKQAARILIIFGLYPAKLWATIQSVLIYSPGEESSDKYIEGPCVLYLSSFSQVLSLCHLSVDVRACKRRSKKVAKAVCK